ncbi:MAG: putative bifunctional diguanylate cyclase/phosphodiesterase [Nakamurella sp.]
MGDSQLDQPLTKVLIEFAHTLGTDFPIQTILDHLVTRIVELLPVTGAGVMLMGADQGLHFVAASDEMVLAIESLQNELIEGPCLDAYHSGQPVAAVDLDADARFPQFSPRASAAGVAAVFSFPLRLEDRCLGALDLYRDVAGPLTGQDLQMAQVLADIAAGYLVSAQARADAEAAAARLHHLSLHDPLTGLPNRTLLVELLDRAVARARRSRSVAAVLFIDLDDFKSVNDTYGHHVGDQLLAAVADRLRRLLRPGDTLARLGGDEFVGLCEDMSGAADAEIIAQRIIAALAVPFDLPQARVSVTGSVGVAFSGPGQNIPALLLRNADFAMYQAKRRGGGQHHLIEPGAREAADSRVEVDRDLHTALALEQFALEYQPIVEVATGKLVGVEALLRWHHPVRGVVMPDVILPSAERTGLMVPIGEWVLRQACRDLAQWNGAAPMPGAVAVNVSAQQMMDPAFAHTVTRVLAETGADPAALSLELTEGLFLGDTARALAVMKQIKILGVRLCLDDFGIGNSSLGYLRHFPVDIVKIDQSFTADLSTDEATRSIVRAVIDLSQVLDLTVVAEGVETLAELDQLAALGVDQAQGYLFGRPLPTNDLPDFVTVQALTAT